MLKILIVTLLVMVVVGCALALMFGEDMDGF